MMIATVVFFLLLSIHRTDRSGKTISPPCSDNRQGRGWIIEVEAACELPRFPICGKEQGRGGKSKENEWRERERDHASHYALNVKVDGKDLKCCLLESQRAVV